ncbi:unnamed protein product [Spirodela intermedia]|uniref:Uncharacterized protein n=1 Tax=Spirodela intermedia TaxID=51605 RepID=A0ABN7E9Q4_SPIIN|nr:unnamed protein product [Spirodela intermedia]
MKGTHWPTRLASRSGAQSGSSHKRRLEWLGLIGACIANPSSKSSLIDRQTSHRQEEDDLPGDESPPLESIPDVMKSLFLLHEPKDEAP